MLKESVWLYFLRTIFVMKNKINKENIKTLFVFQCIHVLKNTKDIRNTKFRERGIILILRDFRNTNQTRPKILYTLGLLLKFLVCLSGVFQYSIGLRKVIIFRLVGAVCLYSSDDS